MKIIREFLVFKSLRFENYFFKKTIIYTGGTRYERLTNFKRFRN